MSVGCKIIKDFTRPDPALVEKFRGIPVANIDDCMGRIGATDSSIKPIGKCPLLGTAFTIRVPAGDNLMLHVAMDMAKPGDVIVLDAGGSTGRAIFGALMSTYMATRGIKGVVCNGDIRDRDELAEMDKFMVYATGATPNGPYKNGPGEINVPVVVGGQVVHPGDIVVGDGDGVVFISPENAPSLLADSLAVVEKEAAIMKHIVEDGTYIRPWVQPLLDKLGCEIVENM